MSCYSCKHGYNMYSSRHCYYEEKRPWGDTCYRFAVKTEENTFVASSATGSEPIKVIDIYPSTPVDSTPSSDFSSGGGGDFGGGGSDGSW